MAAGYTIRKAVDADIDTIVGFTLQEAREAEGIDLDRDGARRGVEGGFDEPPRASYWVAEAADGSVAASTSVVTEWSNFRGGYYWWIQSVYIAPEHRGRGLIDLLLDHLEGVARAAGALDLRLYAFSSNQRALRAYRRHGFEDAPYVIMTRRLR
jgi:GNAT superfamily N-acetyltransferase